MEPRGRPAPGRGRRSRQRRRHRGDRAHRRRASASRVAPQATGHNAGPLAASDGLADALLLRTSELRGVEIDADLRVARVEAGALWGDVVAAVAPYGLAALAGSSHDVGVRRLHARRRHELARPLARPRRQLGASPSSSSRPTACAARRRRPRPRAVLGGARRRRRLRHRHRARVPASTRSPRSSPARCSSRSSAAEEVLQAWAAWSDRHARDRRPRSVGCSASRRCPSCRPSSRASHSSVVEAAIQDSPERVEELLAPLRALGPSMDSVHPQPLAELLQLHMDPPSPIARRRRRHAARRAAHADAVRAFVEAVGTVLGQHAALRRGPPRRRHDGSGCRARGGSRARHAGAWRHRGVRREYLVFGVGIATPDGAELSRHPSTGCSQA